MRFEETPLAGAWVVTPDVFDDERGSFVRSFSQKEFEAHGLDLRVSECATSHNPRTGTLRGMHFQEAPHEQVKLVSCARGSFHDVIVDVRPDSSTYRAWFAVELSFSNRRMLFIPAGFAHGYLTLEHETVIEYRLSGQYHAPSARGFRWNDPAIRITWPNVPQVIGRRDSEYPSLPPSREGRPA